MTSKVVQQSPFCWFAYVEPRSLATSTWFDDLQGGSAKPFLLVRLYEGGLGSRFGLHGRREKGAPSREPAVRSSQIRNSPRPRPCTADASLPRQPNSTNASARRAYTESTSLAISVSTRR